MAVTVDTTNVTNKTGSASSVSFSATVGATANMLVVSGGERATISAATPPTWNGSNLTVLTGADNGGGAHAKQCYIANPTTGTQTCVVTFTSSTNYAIFFIPLIGTAGTINGSAATTATGTSTAPSVTITTSATGELVIDSVSSGGVVTVNGSQTQISNVTNANGNGASSKTGASSVTMSWSTASAAYAISAISVQPTAAAAANSGMLMFM